ncbi:MAG: hypothetical protein JNJ69_03185 [Leptospiraceae bacterium]|nr:hypothetical protein [Leptospiraceae bacterium]
MKLTTSVSLPVGFQDYWRCNRNEIMQFAERYLRICMRNNLRRAVTRTYNRGKGEYRIVTTRFAAAEYDTLHYVAASLRVSVSSLIYGLILLWLKPVRRTSRYSFATNYSCNMIKWDPEAGLVEESLIFWQVKPETRRSVGQSP